MLSGSEELHEGNPFDGDSTPIISSDATISGSLVSTHSFIDDLFEEIDRYYESDQTMVIDLLDEVDEYRDDNTNVVEPADFDIRGPSSTISLDELVVMTIHT